VYVSSALRVVSFFLCGSTSLLSLVLPPYFKIYFIVQYTSSVLILVSL
jgi:hypothetical protein